MTRRVIRLFSKRHERAIYEKRLGLSLPGRLRRRLWYILQKYNFSFNYQPDLGAGWTQTTDFLSELEKELISRYGVEKLVAFNKEDERVEVGLEDFILGAFPAQVLDTLELAFHQVRNPSDLQFDVNEALLDEEVNWRMADGQFFKVDSEFLTQHVIEKSYELLKAEGFEGAVDELTAARADFSSEDYKGAIHNACKSVESVLKSLLSVEQGNAKQLIDMLHDRGFYSDIPESVSKSFGDSVLMALPYLRNRFAGHGQGEMKQEVSSNFARLAINLAATFNLFLIQEGHRQSDQGEDRVDSPDVSEDDDLPF